MRPDPLPLWPFHRAREALEATLIHAEFQLAASSVGELPGDPALNESTHQNQGNLQWMYAAARSMGCEAQIEAVALRTALSRLTTATGPILILVNQGEPRLLAAVLERGQSARVIGPDFEALLPRADFLSRLEALSQPPNLSALFEGLPRGDRALRAFTAAGIGTDALLLARFGPDGSTPVMEQLRHNRAWRWFGAYAALLAGEGAAALLAMGTLGTSAVTGHIDVGRIVAWSVLALSTIPLQSLASRCIGRFSVDVARIVHRRVLEGSFRIDERQVRSQGYGTLLSRAGEATRIQAATLADALSLLTSTGQVVITGVLFSRSTLAPILLTLLLVATAASVFLSTLYVRASARAHDLRVELADDLVDKVIGHRTRAIQQASERYHVSEDAAGARYLRTAQRMDALHAILSVFARLWLVIAGAVLLAGFVLHTAPLSLAWAALGVLFAARAFMAIPLATQRLAEGFGAYRGLWALLDAGLTRDRPPTGLSMDAGLQEVVSVSSVSFAYREGGRPIMKDVSLRVNAGDKVLVRGPSGQGKSTLFKLIAGELRPTGGVILVSGTDVFSVSQEEWRHRVASSPQFHENYVFTQTLDFNLGAHAVPPQTIEEICVELGLGPLIARMPQGYNQLLGETGWQLSHGEKSRLFIARALLQGGDVVLFDESFGALDPETQLRALECVRRRSRTLMVVSHS